MNAGADDEPRQRELQLRAWLRPRFGDVDLIPASADASFRRYFRFRHAADSYVVMDAPPPQEDCRPFVDVAARLTAAGVHVPAVIMQDLERGFLVLSDLGARVYLQALQEADADALMTDAITTLVTMQRHADCTGLPDYDRRLLLRELQLFPDWYLERHLGVRLSPAEQDELAQVFEQLCGRALAQSRVFVHRDYMPRNLMVSDPNPGVLDFQDAVRGPLTYDVICLFKDAFISWPAARIETWLAEYRRQARLAGLPLPADSAEFRADLDWMGLQRHLKVLGIFARIRYRDGKPHYLRDAPRFHGYVMQVAPHYPALMPLAALFERHVMAASA